MALFFCRKAGKNKNIVHIINKAKILLFKHYYIIKIIFYVLTYYLFNNIIVLQK